MISRIISVSGIPVTSCPILYTRDDTYQVSMTTVAIVIFI